MSSAVIQLLVLAGIAIFLILRLRSVLGTRDGFERPVVPVASDSKQRTAPHATALPLPGAPDHDITDHAPEGSAAARALGAMKQAEPSFNVGEFLRGARGAYEMILMAFQKGDLDPVAPYLAHDVLESFREGVAARKEQGVTINANFIGIRELTLDDADFDADTGLGEITVRFVSEITLAVVNAEGQVIEGDPKQVRRQKDTWTFSRRMGVNDPNWQLAATGE